MPETSCSPSQPPTGIKGFARLLLCLAVFVVSLAPSGVRAQQQPSVTLNPDNVSELIKTLESETARQDFIDHLKTLQQAQEAGHDSASGSAGGRLQLNKHFSAFLQRYTDFLAAYDLNTSIVRQALVTTITAIIMLGIGLFVRKSMKGVRDRLLAFQQKHALIHDRFRLYARIVRYGLYGLLLALFVYICGAIWDMKAFAFLKSDTAVTLLSGLLSLALILALGVVIWEIINGFLELAMRQANHQNSSRLRTLLPIAQNVLFVIFMVIFTMIALSELGINVMPLLAGAGIFGIAIGFGAQTMVKDFLTGFIIILEDLIQVGDVATLGGKSGLIEKITIRKVQLRGLDGTVYTVPFSSIEIVENMTKDFSFYLMNIGVAYREDTDQVIALLREIDEELRADTAFGPFILAPLEVLGVDTFADSAVVIKARIKTRPLKQWDVGREFNRRMKYKFDAHNIEIPFPHQTIYFGQDKDGKAPAASVSLQEPAKKAKTSKKT